MPGWRGWAFYSIATAVLVLVFAVAATLTDSPDPGALFGLFQLLAIFAALAWVALVAWRLLTAPTVSQREGGAL